MDPAAEAALGQFVREDWTLFSIGVLFTVLRIYARVKHVGFKKLQADDYLVMVAMVSSVLIRCTEFSLSQIMFKLKPVTDILRC